MPSRWPCERFLPPWPARQEKEPCNEVDQDGLAHFQKRCQVIVAIRSGCRGHSIRTCSSSLRVRSGRGRGSPNIVDVASGIDAGESAGGCFSDCDGGAPGCRPRRTSGLAGASRQTEGLAVCQGAFSSGHGARPDFAGRYVRGNGAWLSTRPSPGFRDHAQPAVVRLLDPTCAGLCFSYAKHDGGADWRSYSFLHHFICVPAHCAQRASITATANRTGLDGGTLGRFAALSRGRCYFYHAVFPKKDDILTLAWGRCSLFGFFDL